MFIEGHSVLSVGVYRKREFPVFSVAFFTQRTAFFFDSNVKYVWILAPDSSLHAFAVSHAGSLARSGARPPAGERPAYA